MNNAIATAAAARIRQYMNEHGLTQRDVAHRAGISQATVSRALKGGALRHGVARSRLFILIKFNESELISARERILTAFDAIWDYSEGQADAVARVIDAIGNVCGQDKRLRGGK
jgi:transcriptional regulator with XRE-family HTH domain